MGTNAADPSTTVFSEEERAAMKARAAELKKEAGAVRRTRAASDELDVLTTIEKMSALDRVLAERIHTLVATHVPDLKPKLWYGQPAYARKGKVVCFFRSGDTDKERYSTLGFTPEAALDDASGLWPTSYALAEMTDEAETSITALLVKL